MKKEKKMNEKVELKTRKGGSIKKKKNWMSWKPEKATQSEKEWSIWDELKLEVGVLREMIWGGSKLKQRIWRGKLRSESEESCWHSVFFTRRGENGSLGIFRKTKDISQRLDWMTLWKFSAYDCQHVYCGIPLIPL